MANLKNTSKECHITLIKSIWLKVVEFILPKRLSSPKILCIICFINEGNFPVTHIMVLIVLKVTVKWLLFDCIPFHETPTHWFVIVKSRLNLSLLPVYCLKHVWHGNGYTTLLEQQFKLLGLMKNCHRVLEDLNVSVVTT